MRVHAAQANGLTEVPVVYVDIPKEQEKALNLALNRIHGEWDDQKLAELLYELKELPEIDLTGFTEQEISELLGSVSAEGVERARLADTFLVPPFSILDSRQAYWQERKRWWRGLIQDEGETREDVLDYSSITGNDKYDKKGIANVSLLDPVLAELAVRWFCPEGGTVFDVFAGDTVFGYVATKLGHNFVGTELRQEQATLNQSRLDKDNLPGTYVCEDGEHILKHLPPESRDLFFTCPPYFDLEEYKGGEHDLSGLPYDAFESKMARCIANAAQVLKPNRFAVIVYGDVRDKQGVYRNLVGQMIEHATKAGLKYYNEGILITPVGTAAIRARQYFKNRKLVKVHQNVLVFYKGDPSQIKDHFPALTGIEEALEGYHDDAASD